MYAVIFTGGKQLKVEVGQKIFVEKIETNVGEEYTFDKVLLISDKKIVTGKPFIEGAKVVAKVEKQGLRKKIDVFKFKPKDNYKKSYGHRQPYTCLTIESISE